MKKRRKIACLLSMLLICVMVITSISSVYAKDKEDTKAVYPLTIAECEGGKIQVKGQKEQTEYYFSAGDQIELEIQAENGYVIKEIQTDDIKEKIDVSNASEIKIFMASHSVHLIPIFEKISNEESKENSQETGDMDQEPPKDLEADEKREQQMKQILKEIGVGFAEQSDTATFQLSRVAGERINTGAIKTNIGKIDVVDYNGSQWKFLLTWQEGKLGNINTGEGLYCTNPTISFQPGIKTGVDASTIYNKATIQANEKGLVLEDAEFTLYSDKKCTKEVAKLKTDEKGVVTFADLKVGQKYYLKETKAPQGYRIPVDGNGNPYFYEVEVTSNPVNDEFKIFLNGREVDSSDGIFTLTGTKADRIVSMTVINMTGKKLPETGSNQMLFFIFAAFVAGIITVMMKKRKL